MIGLVALDRVYVLGIAPSAGAKRVAIALCWGVAGLLVMIALGWFTKITHMCG